MMDVMNHKQLVDIVGHGACREFDIVWKDWCKECHEDNDGDIDPYATALLLFAAGYVARRNDEILMEDRP